MDPLRVTVQDFQAFLDCPTKAHLTQMCSDSRPTPFAAWCSEEQRAYAAQCSAHLRARFPGQIAPPRASPTQRRDEDVYRIWLDCPFQTSELQSRLHAIELLTARDHTGSGVYVPIRFVASERITSNDKLLLAFDALVLSASLGTLAPFGRIIHGNPPTSVRVSLGGLLEQASAVVRRMIAQYTHDTPPDLVLNRHCPQCVFQSRCRQTAIDNDELSLLGGMSEAERQTLRSRGILSLIQLSYTFRARRRRKQSTALPERHSHALKALALRERKIHIAGNLQLNLAGTPIYLDVEGIPDRGFYYLIGMRIPKDEGYLQHSLWANGPADERSIWAEFLRLVAAVDQPQLVHYGSYEAAFLRCLSRRYPETAAAPDQVNALLSNALNILPIVYEHVYFPTYSNGLKEIAQFLGFQWTHPDAAGLSSLMWRGQWERTREPTLQERILTYNAEDCEALEKVTHAVSALCGRPLLPGQSSRQEAVHTGDLANPEGRFFAFGKNEFLMPEFESISRAAYWDYQRDRVYVKTSRSLARVAKAEADRQTRKVPVDRTVDYSKVRPASCPACGMGRVLKYGRRTKQVHDLRFTRSGIRRWIVRYLFDRYICTACHTTFFSEDRPWTRSKYGHNALAYMIYQLIELRLSHLAVAECLTQSFNFDLSRGTLQHQKRRAADLYLGTYEGILNRITSGKLVHADETRVNIGGREGYVWVLANLEEVAYFYTPTREGDRVLELLHDFRGVLVSDFYAVYDSVACPQQKCLIHLIRDLNTDLTRQPFNEELKEIMRRFALLLQPIVQTVDEFGLRSRSLRRHRGSVESFYEWLGGNDYSTEVAVGYWKRLLKNREKLFTFLAYDGVPWNNSNAEHAIKAFVGLRNVIGGGSSEQGIKDYLTLLSVCETCKYKGVKFLDFLRSGEMDIGRFARRL